MATQAQKMTPEIARGRYLRFDLLARLEHLVLLVSFTLLGATGLPQKFAGGWFAEAVIKFFGGIEMTRTIHHLNAIVMILLAVYHVVAVGYRIFVLRRRLTMLPMPSDFSEWWQDTRYKLGLAKIPAKFGRYNYGEKMEYWAMMWGTLVMGLTGLMLWNPICDSQARSWRVDSGRQSRARRRSHPGCARHHHLALLQRAHQDVQQEHVHRALE